MEVGLDELHPVEPEAPRGPGAEQERGARQVGADDQRSARARYRHIWPVPQPTSTIRASPGIGPIEQARELAPLGPRAKRVQAVARRIAGERGALVEPPHRLGARVAREPQVGNPVWRVEARAAAVARPDPTASAPAQRRTGEQVPEGVHGVRRSRR